MKLKDVIKDYKIKTGKTNVEIAKELGVAHTTVGRWISGDVDHIRDETAEKMKELFGYDVKGILGADPTFRIPILGYTKAGYDLFLEKQHLGDVEVSYSDYRKGDYFLKVIGDSMINAGIVDGSYVFVKATPYVNNGEIAIIRIGDEVTVKRFFKTRGGIILKAANSFIEDRQYTSEEIVLLPVEIIGKVLYCKVDLAYE